MDILNFISWIKAGNYRTTLPTDVPNLLAIGSRDVTRDDAWLPMAVNAAPLQSLYDTGTVTQLTSITTAVTLNTFNGVIRTVPSTLAANAKAYFNVQNDKVTANSRVIVSASYPGAAASFPVVSTGTIGAGYFSITIANAGGAALNNIVLVHFMIIN